MRKIVLLASSLTLLASDVSAETRLIHPDGWAFNAEEACVSDYYTYEGVRYNIDRYQGRLSLIRTTDGTPALFDFKCPKRVKAGGGGGGSTTFKDEWKDSDLVDDDGNVTMNPGEVKTDHPTTDPNDSGFEGDGPLSIDG